MSRISLIDSPADERAVRVFDDIRAQLGGIPNIFRAYANSPHLLELTWERYGQVILTGSLSRPLKEGIALMVSADNHCDYGISHHSDALQKLGVDPQEIMRIRNDPDHAHFPPREHALLEVARHGNTAPHDHGERLVNTAREAGADDAEIVEALAIAGLVAELNRFADMLDIPV